MTAFLCRSKIYKYGKWFFEYGYCGPWPLKKDGELRKRMGRKFFADLKPFFDLSEKEQEIYRVGGGCVEI